MRSLLFIILAGYAVRCDDASYYVIEMPEESPREFTRPFRVYWNVPTMQCRSKKIPFTGLYDKFGIIQNSGDSFRGEKVAILYDPGLFPALLKNETSGKFKFRNGGVPQEGDLEKHLVAFRNALEQSIPDEQFSGIGIIDFESWRPVFRQNFGILIPYKDISYQIERKLHWFWTERAIQARARQRFEEAGRAFMQTTLSVAKQMRPRALWGYYGFPYCFNMAAGTMEEHCPDKVKQENDKTYWLWSESTALYPSVYSSRQITGRALAALVRERVREARREARAGTPVLPYFWFRYREGGFLSQNDLDTVLETLYKANASGFIIWGSSNDVNTIEKCQNLLQYTEEVMGPAIAKYTKPHFKNSTDTTSNPVSNSGLTTWRPILRDHLNNTTTTKPTPDPEYEWEPPENYTQDIVRYVDQELKKKPGYNSTKTTNDTVHIYPKKNLLLDIIMNIFKLDKEDTDVKENAVNIRDEDNQNGDRNTIAFTSKVNTEYNSKITTIPPNIITHNPLLSLLKDEKKGTPEKKYIEKNLHNKPNSVNSKVTTTPLYTTKSYVSFTNKNESSENMTTTTEPNNVTESNDDILYDIVQLESNASFIAYSDVQDNVTVTTEPNLVTENSESLYNFTQSTENASTGNIDFSTEVTKLSTFGNTVDNITEIYSNINNYEVTNTSQDDTDVIFDEETNTSVNNTEIWTEENSDYSTTNYKEVSSTETSHIELHLVEKSQVKMTSKNHKKSYVGINTINIKSTSEPSTNSATDLESTTEKYEIIKDTESFTEDYRDIIYDENERLSTDTKETDEYVSLGINAIDNIIFSNTNNLKDRKKGFVLGREDKSTNTESTISTSVEELSKSTTEYKELTASDVPELENEGYYVIRDDTTESWETTTEGLEVAGTSYGTVVQSYYIYTLISVYSMFNNMKIIW
ncbi:uncharacterized protein LOC114358255 isoform X1 [Ostrinia furnacalis]|uniref:uncharacterized protein LOC114358255 isoform X1 n=3 Tax=Ostrinia furnacalis TaxID=93504 RepID=UPI00103F5592|nr:uncharacterized protein LOC114358255 isoform X1 [Ostrinia furnacalis]